MKACHGRVIFFSLVLLCSAFPARAQDLGPGFTNLRRRKVTFDC